MQISRRSGGEIEDLNASTEKDIFTKKKMISHVQKCAYVNLLNIRVIVDYMKLMSHYVCHKHIDYFESIKN